MSRGNTRSRSYSTPSGLSKIAPYPVPANRAPVGTDVGYDIGQLWSDIPNQILYGLAAYEGGLAVWINLSSSGGSSVSITDFVVGPVPAPYQTVQSAITAAAATNVPQAVYIQPAGSPYIEDITLAPNVSLVGTPLGGLAGPVIQGTVTLPTSPPTQDKIAITGITFEGDTEIFIGGDSGTAILQFIACQFGLTGTGAIFNAVNFDGGFILNGCADNSDSLGGSSGVINNSSAANIILQNCSLGTASGSMTLDGSNFVQIYSSTIYCTWFQAGGGQGIAIASVFGGGLNVSANTIFQTQGCQISGIYLSGSCSYLSFQGVYSSNHQDSDSAISTFYGCDFNVNLTHNSVGTMTLNDCVIDNVAANVIAGTGAGVVNINNSTFVQSSGIAGTITAVIGGVAKLAGIQIPTTLAAPTIGTATLSSGQVTVSTAAVQANAQILLTYFQATGTLGSLFYANIVPGVQFTIASTIPADANQVTWLIINPPS